MHSSDPWSLPLEDRIALARGETPVDLLVRNCRLVNVLSGEVHAADVAVAAGHVVGFGDYAAAEVLDAGGRFLAPGLIDGHIHIESTLLAPEEFARVAAAHGTAAVVADPHEIANVLGLSGIRWMLEATDDLPLGFFFMMPSCVPATHLETSGAALTAADVSAMLAQFPERMPGLAEMMNFPGVIFRDQGVLAKLRAASGLPVDGHAPLLSGKDLAGYLIAGPDSDHECSRVDEAREKLRLGMHIFIRQGTGERNLEDLLPLVTPANAHRFSLVCDDRHPQELVHDGHMDHLVRLAVAHGLDAVSAVRLASWNTARRFGLRRRGAVAPGYRADFVLLDDLDTFAVHRAFLGGCPVEELDFSPRAPRPGNSMRLGTLDARTFHIPAPPGRSRVRAITCAPGQIVTGEELLAPLLVDGAAQADPARDLAKLAVVERHTGSGNVGLGFVRGLSLARGALASSVAHDSHNLIVAGMDDADMAVAARECARLGGGFVAALDGRVLAALPLPVAGLMSDAPLETVLARFAELEAAWRRLGYAHPHGNPFMTLSFLALPVIPALKLTDKGLVDVSRFDFTDLWAD